MTEPDSPSVQVLKRLPSPSEARSLNPCFYKHIDIIRINSVACLIGANPEGSILYVFVFFRKDTHLVPLHAWHGVAEDLEHDEEVLLLAAGELVRRLGDEPRIGLGLLIGARLQRCRRPVKTLKAEERRKTAHIWLGRTRRRRRAGNGQTDGNACSGNILWAAPVWSPSSDHASYNIQLEHV